MTILNDPHLERLLDRLHDASGAQTEAIREYHAERDKPSVARRRNKPLWPRRFSPIKSMRWITTKLSSAIKSAALSTRAVSSRSGRHMVSRRSIWLLRCATTCVPAEAAVW